MRTKVTALITTAAVIAVGAIAQAAPVTVALYTFQTAGDPAAFQRVLGEKCARKWRGNMALGINVGPGTNTCAFRTSVVADSTDTAPDQGISAIANLGAAPAGKKGQKKGYVGIGVRQSDEASYVLRVLPFARKWQVLRDPKGTAPAALMASGAGKFVKKGLKPNSIAIRAFDFGTTSTSLVASVNGVNVVSTTDAATTQPDGRRTAVYAGVKGTGSGEGVIGVFDNVTVQVPSPF
jgi:hypothetical protein